jgi:hypothetical protein
MSEIATRSAAQEQQEQKRDTRTFVERIAGFTIVATAAAALAVPVAKAVHVQDKYSLKSPSGIAFSDFRGIRGLGCRLFRPDRRSAQGNRR